MRSHISMTKRLSLVLVLLMFSSAHLRGQQWTDPLLYYPRFEDCSSESREALPNCFTQHINLLMQEASKSWGIENSSKGQVSVLFEVDKSGEFVLRYISIALRNQFALRYASFLPLCPLLSQQTIMVEPFICSSSCIFLSVI